MTGAHVDDRTAVLEARNVSLDFDGTDSSGSKVTIHALDRVNLTIHRGEITALVGESGSGKTSIARLFALIYKPTSGELYRNGELVHVHGKRAERAYYRDVQLIYQDPFASLNGLKKISTILGRVFKIHYPKMRRKEIAQRIDDVLTKVNMTPPSRYLNRYPTDLSGGQRQRIAIARALAVSPQVLLADEPTSMLDASIRLDVLNLLSDLRETEGVSVLYITHDIASARYICDRINVMYGGRIVEAGPVEQVFRHPRHRYTQGLLGSSDRRDVASALADLEKVRGAGAARLRDATLQQIEQDPDLHCEEVQYLVDFIRHSKRGVVLRRARSRQEELVED